MDTSQAAEWLPVFPEPQPPHWVAFANFTSGVRMISDVAIGSNDQVWLLAWLGAYENPAPGRVASYVYMGLAESWADGEPNGRVSSSSVLGIGTGEGFQDPSGAVPSTFGAIVDAARDLLC